MTTIEPLSPDNYARIPWKNGRGALLVIDREGADTWDNMGVAWHFGRTTIVEEGPFSDYSGYERLQVAIRGEGLSLVAADHEINLSPPLTVQRYDGGLPVRTRLLDGPVEVVNLIAIRAKFDIDLQVLRRGKAATIVPGRHVAYAPTGAATVTVGSATHTLAEDHTLRVAADAATTVRVEDGTILLGSITSKG